MKGRVERLSEQLTLSFLLQSSEFEGCGVGHAGIAWLIVLQLQTIVELRQLRMLPLRLAGHSAGGRGWGMLAGQTKYTVFRGLKMFRDLNSL